MCCTNVPVHPKGRRRLYQPSTQTIKQRQLVCCWVRSRSISEHAWLSASYFVVQAVKYQPKNVQAWNVLGLCHTSMGDIGDGIAAYQKAIDLQPDHREAWANLAQARKEVAACLHQMLINL